MNISLSLMQPFRILNRILSTDFQRNTLLQVTWTLLRVVAGVCMIHNGLDKLSDIEGFSAAYVEVIGLPFPIFFSYVAAFTELLASPLLAIGLLTRPAALGLLGTMLVAMYHHILVAGFNIPYLELPAIYTSIFIFFLINGAGKFSVDNLLLTWVTKMIVMRTQRRLELLETTYIASSSDEEKTIDING